MITLEEYSKTVQDKWDTSAVIDELRKNSYLFNTLSFDNTVTNTGASFVYGYTRKIQNSGAGFRKVGEEYQTSDAKTDNYTARIAILGGAYQIDRAIAFASKGGFIDQDVFQKQEKVKAAVARFNDCVINGDSAGGYEFDGLKKILRGSVTDITASVDISTPATVDTNYAAFEDAMDEVISSMDGTPSAILVNRKTKNRINACARRSGQFARSIDEFGAEIDTYNGIPIVDLGDLCDTASPVIPVADDGTSDIYFVRYGYDGFHGFTLTSGMMNVTTPDWHITGSQLNGSVEMYAGVVLKSTKAAAVLHGVKVASAKTSG